jgi:DNA-binding protein H-NS
MDVSAANLDSMTEAELRQLIQDAEKVLERLIAQRARSTLKEARRLAAEVGFEVTFAKAGKPAGGKAKAAAPRSKAVQKYRNPDNPVETWAGRGRPPKWVQAALEAGQSLEDLAIAREGTEAAA